MRRDLTKLVRDILDKSLRTGLIDKMEEFPHLKRIVVDVIRKINEEASDTLCPVYYLVMVGLTSLVNHGLVIKQKEPEDAKYNQGSRSHDLGDLIHEGLVGLFKRVTESEDRNERATAANLLLVFDRMEQTVRSLV